MSDLANAQSGTRVMWNRFEFERASSKVSIQSAVFVTADNIVTCANDQKHRIRLSSHLECRFHAAVFNDTRVSKASQTACATIRTGMKIKIPLWWMTKTGTRIRAQGFYFVDHSSRRGGKYCREKYLSRMTRWLRLMSDRPREFT